MTAIKEELARDSDPQSLDRKRVGYVPRSARVGIESFPQGGPEVRDDFDGYTGTFFCPSRLADSNMNVVLFKE